MTEARERAARRLAAIILVDLDIEIEPAKLVQLLHDRWGRIAPLAHTIHSKSDETKPAPAANVGNT